MITLTADQLEKINLLDTLFDSLDVTQLRELVEKEKVVSKLKGDHHNSGILSRLVQEHDILYMDLTTTKAEVGVLKNDFKELMRVLSSTLFTVPYSQEFQNLKSRHNIY